MEFVIGENIRRFRRSRDLTQEELADRLGVSFQAVSKWERGDGLPDITMLPVLACFFRVTVDELLGMDDIRSREKLDNLNAQWAENNKAGRNRENVALMREALRLFPDDALLLVQLSTSLEKAGGDEAEKRRYLLESVAVQERILQLGDSEVRNATQYNICYSYWKAGEKEKAVRQAKKLPNLYKNYENAIISFVGGEEQLEVSAQAYERIAWTLYHHLSTSAENTCLTVGEKISCLEKIQEIFKILFEGQYTDYVKGFLDRTDAALSELKSESF